MKEIPDHVSWRVQDAWLCIPPCSYTEEPFCHVDCPYFGDCNPPEDEYDYDMDKWEEYYENERRE